MINKIVVATHNRHKSEEIQAILSPLGIQVVCGDDVGLTEIEETGTTFEENALQKARAAYQQVKIPVLADDSGLCVAAMNDRPGLFSARYAKENGGYPAVFDVVQREIGDNPNRSAYFMCCMVLVTGPNQQDEHVFVGKMTGKIAHQASGTHLFGYDPIFIPDGYCQSCGALPPETKNKISHRAKALQQLIQFLKG